MSCLSLLLAFPLTVFAAPPAQVARASNLRGTGSSPIPPGVTAPIERKPPLETHWISPGVYPPGESALIKCPFLRMVRPNTTNLDSFADDLEAHGLDRPLALQIGSQVLFAQRPDLYASLQSAINSRQAPFIYNLDKAIGIVHDDRYLPYFDEVKARVQRYQNPSGLITYNDTVELKYFVADRSKTCIVNDASKLETRILFIRSGGDLESGLVMADDWLRLLQGLVPHRSGFNVLVGGTGRVDASSIAKIIELEQKQYLWSESNSTCSR